VSILTTDIRATFDALLEKYDALLRTHPTYVRMPAQLRRDTAQRTLALALDWLESGDDAQLIQFIQTAAQERLAQSPDVSMMQHAVRMLGALIAPLIADAPTAQKVWDTLFKAQEIIAELMMEALRQEIAERQQAETALQSVATRFRAIYESTNDAIMLLTPTGFFDCNPQTLQLFGFASREEFIQAHPGQISPPFQPDGRDSTTASLERIEVAYQQGYNRFEWVHRRQDGVDFQAEVVLSAFELEGRQVLQAIVRDIEPLVRRGRQVRISTEVAQEIATAPALEELFRRVVTLIKERFGYYHAQIFRYDPAQDAAVLVTGYGETGAQMLAAGHKLAMGRGVVGTAAATGRSILTPDTARDADWRPNPYLPDTRGELAVPIKLRGEILGVLDVQSDRVGVLTQEDQLLLEGLCGQIALAIEQKRSEAALAYEHYLLETLLENVPAAIYFKDLESRFLRVSRASARAFGCDDPAEAIGKTDFDFFTEEHARPAYEDEQHIIRTGEIVHKEELETRIGRPDTWTLTTKMPLRDANGVIVGTFGISVDTTETKVAEIRLNAERNLMRSIIDSTPDWIFVKDQEHRYQLVNASCARALHLQPEDFIGKNDLEVGFTEDVVKGDPDREIRGFRADEREAMDTDRMVTSPRVPITLDGVVHIFDDMRVPLHDAEGRVWGVLGISRDVTEREQVDARMRETVQELERLYRAATREGWRTFHETGRLASGYRFDRVNVAPAEDLWMPQIQPAVEATTFVSTTERETVAVTPLAVRGEVIGALGVYDDPQHPLSADEVTLLEEIIEQGALALENARLFEESQHRAVREQVAAQVTARIRETLDMEAVLRTAAEQLRQTLDLEDLVIQLATPETAPPSAEGVVEP